MVLQLPWSFWTFLHMDVAVMASISGYSGHFWTLSIFEAAMHIVQMELAFISVRPPLCHLRAWIVQTACHRVHGRHQVPVRCWGGERCWEAGNQRMGKAVRRTNWFGPWWKLVIILFGLLLGWQIISTHGRHFGDAVAVDFLAVCTWFFQAWEWVGGICLLRHGSCHGWRCTPTTAVVQARINATQLLHNDEVNI